MATKTRNNTVDKYHTIPLRLASDGHELPVSEAEQCALTQMSRLQKDKNSDILVVLFDAQKREFRFWVNGHRAGIVKA